MSKINIKVKVFLFYAYLFIGFLGIVALLVYSHYFGGELINSVPYAKAGLVTIIIYSVLWIVFFFVLLSSSFGKDIQSIYLNRNKKKQKRNISTICKDNTNSSMIKL